MTFMLAQVMASVDSEAESGQPKKSNSNRTLKRRPAPQLNKLKNATRGAAPLTDDIYLEDREDASSLPDNKPSPEREHDDEPSESDYRLLGMGHPDNNFAEEEYKAYLNRYKHTSPLLDQSAANDIQTSGEYQQQYAAGHNQYVPPTMAQGVASPDRPSEQNDALLKKLNYMIHLLEEQKNEQTNNVTEELILYIFLGIFVIFVVDSFTKVGKYQR